MLYPFRIASEGRWLLPPAAGFEDIHPAIAVDVSKTQAVGEPLPVAFGGDFVKGPGPGGVAPIGRGIAKVTARVADDFGFAVARQVTPGGRFIIDYIKDLVPNPVLGAVGVFLALWVFVPRGVQAGETIN